MQQILILGGGFAGLWSAAGAARLLDQRGIAPVKIRVTLVNRDDWHCIRVRNYEPGLHDVRVPLADVLEPIGVDRIIGDITEIDLAARQVACDMGRERKTLTYDRLVLAIGSTLLRPPIPGLVEHGFDIDTYGAAERLQAHIDCWRCESSSKCTPSNRQRQNDGAAPRRQQKIHVHEVEIN